MESWFRHLDHWHSKISTLRMLTEITSFIEKVEAFSDGEFYIHGEVVLSPSMLEFTDSKQR